MMRFRAIGWVVLAWISLVGAEGSAAEPLVWRLDDPTRVAGHAATSLGAPRVISDSTGLALYFDGKADGIGIPVNPLEGCATFTIEVLFKPEEGGLAAQRFFHLQDVESRRVMLETRLDGKGHWWLDTFLGATGVSQPLIDATRIHPTGRWYWIALRFDGTHMANFINGELELARAAKFGPMVAGQLSLGVRQNKVYWFKGALAEVRWHTTALEPQQLQRR